MIRMKRNFIVLAFVFVLFSNLTCSSQARSLIALKTNTPPVVDGSGDDLCWDSAEPVIVFDPVADRQVTVKAVYDDSTVWFAVIFPDSDESRLHKPWVWDKGRDQYVMGNMREDVCVFKWNMESKAADLSLNSDMPNRSDIWFWKANRTDPVGYADDKQHVLSNVETRESTKVTGRSDHDMFLLRREDSGRKAYSVELLLNYDGDIRNRYRNSIPSGSRADVRAKGQWHNGLWTIEFSRALVTGNEDDIQFSKLDRSYQFGVSTLEIAGRDENPALSEPLYGSGDIGEVLDLVFSGR